MSPIWDQVRRILGESREIAILGAHVQPAKAAFYVPDYLAQQGYEIHPVNPKFVGRELFGRPVVATVGDVGRPIDMVDVFRQPWHLDQHADEILALDPLPKVVWFQAGIRNDGAAERLSQAGIEVIQDRCTLADHQYLADQLV